MLTFSYKGDNQFFLIYGSRSFQAYMEPYIQQYIPNITSETINISQVRAAELNL